MLGKQGQAGELDVWGEADHLQTGLLALVVEVNSTQHLLVHRLGKKEVKAHLSLLNLGTSQILHTLSSHFQHIVTALNI